MTNPYSAHNSDGYKYPAKGHIKSVTINNMCIGNNYYWHIPKDKAIFQYIPYNKCQKKCKQTPETPAGKTDNKEWSQGVPSTVTDGNATNEVNNSVTMHTAHTTHDKLSPSATDHYWNQSEVDKTELINLWVSLMMSEVLWLSLDWHTYWCWLMIGGSEACHLCYTCISLCHTCTIGHGRSSWKVPDLHGR